MSRQTVAWLLWCITVVMAMTVTNFPTELVVPDCLGPGKECTVRQNIAQVTCTHTDARASFPLRIVQLEPGQTVPKILRLTITCYPPLLEWIQRKLSRVPLCVTNMQLTVCPVPFSQPNMTEGVIIEDGPTPQWPNDSPVVEGGMPEVEPIQAGQRRLFSMSNEERRAAMERLRHFTKRVRDYYGETETVAEERPEDKITTDNSSPARRRLLAIRPQVGIGWGGIGVGFDLGCLIPQWSFLGGCGPNDLDAVLGKIERQFRDIELYMRTNEKWQGTVENRFSRLEEFQAVVTGELDRQRQSISLLNQEIGRIWGFTKELAEYTTQGFEQFKSELAKQHEVQEAVTNLVLELWNSTNQQFLETNAAIQSNARLQQDTITTMWQMMQDLGRKRAMTRLYWDYDDAEVKPLLANKNYQPLCNKRGICDNTIQPTRKFLGAFRGNPPLGFAGTRNLAKSMLMADTSVQFTQLVNTVRFAYSYNLQYRCDKEFILNRVMPSVSLKTLFARIGPAGCNAGTEWSCQCVVVWKKQWCELSNQGMVYPFGFAKTGLRLSQDNAQPKNPPVCRPATYQEEADVVITSQAQLTGRMADNFCNKRLKMVTTNQVISGKTVAVAVRIVAGELGQQNDIPDPSQTATSCLSSFASAATGDNMLSTFVYRAWQQTYAVIAKTNMVLSSNDHFGLVPSPDDGLRTDEIVFGRDDVTHSATSCLKSQYTNICQESEWMYELQLSSQVAGLELTINDQPDPLKPKVGVEMFDIGTGLPESGGAGNSVLKAATTQLVTNIVPTIKREAQAPPTLRRFGWYDPNKACSTGSSDACVYDTAPDQQCSALSASGCCGKINYVQQFLNWTGSGRPINLQQWKDHYQTSFNPECAMESLLPWRRYLDPVTWECRYDFSTGLDYFEFHEWCNLLRFFLCHPPFKRGNLDLLVCEPREWSYTAYLTIPAGTVQVVTSSMCPDVSIRQTGVTSWAYFSSKVAAPNTIEWWVTPNDTTLAKDLSCKRSGKLTLMPNLPVPVEIAVCPGGKGKLFLNVKTLFDDPTKPCFRPPGIDVTHQADYSGNTLPPVGPEVDKYMKVFTDSLTNTLTQQIEWLTDFQFQLQRMAAEGKSKAEIQKKIHDILENRTYEIEKLFIKNITDRIKDIDKFINDASGKIADNVEKGKQAIAELEKLQKDMRDLNRQGRDLVKNMSAIIDKYKKDLDDLHDEIERYKASNAKKCSPVIPILGDVLCFVADFFSSLLNPNTGKWIVLAIILVLCCVVCVPLCLNCSRNPEARASCCGDCGGRAANFFESSDKHPVQEFSSTQAMHIQAALEALRTTPARSDLVQLYKDRFHLMTPTTTSGTTSTAIEMEPLIKPPASTAGRFTVPDSTTLHEALTLRHQLRRRAREDDD
jgi:hypothetical protein